MNFIYIVSLPRSGSTLLQRLINSNENSVTLPETWYLISQNIFLANKEGSLETGFYVNKNALTSFCENLEINGQVLFKSSVEKYRQILSQNKFKKYTYFVEKTPRNILLIDNIYESLEEKDKIIILRRNPNAVFKSYLKYFDSFPYLKAYKFYKEIKNYSRIIENFDNSNKDKTKVLSVDYESLIDGSDETIIILQNFLGFNLNKNNLSLEYNLKSKKFHGDVSGLSHNKISKPKKNNELAIKILSVFFFKKTSIFLKIIIFPLVLPSFVVYKINPRIMKLLVTKNTFTH